MGESIWDNENRTLTCSAAQPTSASIADNTVFQLGMVVLGATLGPTVQTYLIEPIGSFMKPFAEKLYRGTIGPYIDDGFERLYRRLPQNPHLYSRADMDDLKPLLASSLDSYWLQYIQDIDIILLHYKWFKQPVVIPLIQSIDLENVDNLSGEKKLLGYIYKGFKEQNCEISMLLKWSKDTPENKVYKLNHFLNNPQYFYIVNKEFEFPKVENIIKKKKQNKDLYNSILKASEPEVANILSGFINNERMTLYSYPDKNMLYIVFPLQEESLLDNFCIKIEIKN